LENEIIEFEDICVEREDKGAILFRIDGKRHWIPKCTIIDRQDNDPDPKTGYITGWIEISANVAIDKELV
jgi:hypothetical protein